MSKKIGGFFVRQVRKDLSLKRLSKNLQRQTWYDRLGLTFSGWAHFYFNYSFSTKFEGYLKELSKLIDAEEFRQSLLELFELHYLSALMSFNTSGFMFSDIQQRHFSDMQYGYQCLSAAEGSTPNEIIDNTLDEMLYHDITYNWCTRPLFGSMSCYYSAKTFLYHVKRELAKTGRD